MNSKDLQRPLKMRAMEELKALLEQSHSIRLKEILQESQGSGSRIDLLARIDVFGHSHTLACAVQRGGTMSAMRDDLRHLCEDIGRQPEEMMPILIAPRLSSKLRTLCIERNVGFLDFEGNGRVILEEAFIGKRTRQHGPGGHHRSPVTGVRVP